jgi:hypothetical protein
VPRLPENPSLEHLKNQAKTLLVRARAGDEQALAWVRDYHPDPPAELRLAGAQLVVARAYGFASWPKLRAHLDVVGRYTRSPHRVEAVEDPAGEFLRLACLTYSNDDPARWEAARAMLAKRPALARASLHAAAARWFEADAAAAITMAINSAGQPQAPSRGFDQIRQALGAWSNDPQANFRYADGGLTSAAGMRYAGVNASASTISTAPWTRP